MDRERLRSGEASRLRRALTHAALVVTWIMMWEVLTRYAILDEFWVGRPTAIVRSFGVWLSSDGFLNDIFATARVAIVGFGLGAFLGMALATVMHQSPLIRGIFRPMVDFSYAIPKPVFVPVLIFAFGFGDIPKIILVVLLVMFVFYYSVYDGLRLASERLVDAIRMLGATRAAIGRYVLAPAAALRAISAARVSAPFAIVGAAFVEFFGSTEGVGRQILIAGHQFAIDRLFAGILVLTAMGAIADVIPRRLDTWTHRWRPK